MAGYIPENRRLYAVFRFCHHHFPDPCDCPRRWPWCVGRGQSAGGLWLQSLLIHVTMWAINIVIFVIVYGRMIEIYLLTSLAPIPVATLSNRELGNTGQNYLKSLFAVGFQGLLILVCVAIYAVLIQGIATSGDPIGAIWGCMGYSVLLCFCLLKTGTIARSIFGAH